jgi:hypothetical protein
MIVLLLCQFALGMVANLYVTVPAHHPGAHPSNYLSGSASSVGWALGHGATALAAHAALGLALVAFALATAAFALALRTGRTAAIAGVLLIIGAGFNGASFLDFNENVSSLIMALLFAAATLSYTTLIYRLPLIESGNIK